MSADYPVNKTTASKMKLIDDVISKIDDYLEGDSDSIMRAKNEVNAALKRLKIAVNRQGVEMVADLVRKGELMKANDKLKENFQSIEVGQLEEVLKLSLRGKQEDLLENTINFVAMVDQSLRATACTSIYDEMCFLNLTTEVEILLLQSKVDKLDGVEKLKSKIGKHVEKLIEKIVKEIQRGESEISDKVINNCTLLVFNKTIPLAVEEFFSKTPDDATLLAYYAQSLPNWSKTLIRVVCATFKQMKQRKLLNTEAALHVLAVALHGKTYYSCISVYEKRELDECIDELSQNCVSYFEIMRTRLENSELSKCIGKLHYMANVMEDFVKWYCKDDMNKVKAVIKASVFTGFFKISGRMQKTVYDLLVEWNCLTTFDAFLLFHAVYRETKINTYHPKHPNVTDITFVIDKVPKILHALLWGENRKCKVINKYYGEPMFLPANDDAVFSWVPCTEKENQHWEVTVDEDSSLLRFTHASGSKKLGCTTTGNVTTTCVDAQGMQWMIKADVTGEYVKIFKSDDEYLTADLEVCSSDGDKRKIQLRSENTTDMQLWQIEFVR